MPADVQDRILAFLADPVLPVVLTVVVALVLIRLVGDVVHRLFETARSVELRQGDPEDPASLETGKRIATLDALVTWILRGFIIVIAGIMVLSQLGVDVGPALAGLGIAGIAVGFGAQSLVKDYFNGSLILLENQFSKGDVVTIAGVTGTVEDFSLRRTTVRDLDGVLHTVPNSEIKVASNRTRVWARVNLDVTVAYGTDVERATRVVDEVGAALAADGHWSGDILETPQVTGVQSLGEYGVTLKVLGKTRAQAQPAVAAELRRRLLAAFEQNGIALPQPRRVVLANDAAPDPFARGGPSDEELSTGSE